MKNEKTKTVVKKVTDVATVVLTNTTFGNWPSEGWEDMHILFDAFVTDSQGRPLGGKVVFGGTASIDGPAITWVGDDAITDPSTGIARLQAIFKDAKPDDHVNVEVNCEDKTGETPIVFLVPEYMEPNFPGLETGSVITENDVANGIRARVPLTTLEYGTYVHLKWDDLHLFKEITEIGQVIDFDIPEKNLTYGNHNVAYYVVGAAGDNVAFSKVKKMFVVRDVPEGTTVDQPVPVITRAEDGVINYNDMILGVKIETKLNFDVVEGVESIESGVLFLQGYDEAGKPIADASERHALNISTDGIDIEPVELKREFLEKIGDGGLQVYFILSTPGGEYHYHESFRRTVQVHVVRPHRKMAH